MAVSLRVLVAKEELERLQELAKYHEQNCLKNHQEASEKNGGGHNVNANGDVEPPNSINKAIPALSSPNMIEDSDGDQRANLTIEKQTLIDSNPETSKSESKDREINEFPMESVINSVRKRYKGKATQLVHSLKSISSFALQDYRVIINGELLPNSDIRLLIQMCFYPIKTEFVLDKINFLPF